MRARDRDRLEELIAAEFNGWFDAQGWPLGEAIGAGDVRDVCFESFKAGLALAEAVGTADGDE